MTETPDKATGCTIWGNKPRNPVCGLISLETGARLFLGLYTYWMIFQLALGFCGICVMAFYAYTESSETDPWDIKFTNYNGHIAHAYIILFVLAMLIFSVTAYFCSKCMTSLEKEGPFQMKKYFWIVLLLITANTTISVLIDSDPIILTVFDVPVTFFSILGMLFVFNRIVERIHFLNQNVAPDLQP